jgi:hypothetical protein
MVGMTWATFPLNLVEPVTLFSKLPKQGPQKVLAIVDRAGIKSRGPRTHAPGKSDW